MTDDKLQMADVRSSPSHDRRDSPFVICHLQFVILKEP